MHTPLPWKMFTSLGSAIISATLRYMLSMRRPSSRTSRLFRSAYTTQKSVSTQVQRMRTPVSACSASCFMSISALVRSSAVAMGHDSKVLPSRPCGSASRTRRSAALRPASSPSARAASSASFCWPSRRAASRSAVSPSFWPSSVLSSARPSSSICAASFSFTSLRRMRLASVPLRLAHSTRPNSPEQPVASHVEIVPLTDFPSTCFTRMGTGACCRPCAHARPETPEKASRTARQKVDARLTKSSYPATIAQGRSGSRRSPVPQEVSFDV